MRDYQPLIDSKVVSLWRLFNIFGKGLSFMITPETMLMGFLTVIAIFIVSKDVLNISFSIEFTIFSAGCIFPTTFSVEAAFDRRELAMERLAKLKATIVALFSQFIFLDQSRTGAAAIQIRPLLGNLVDHIEIFCRSPDQRKAAHWVYDDLSRLSESIHAVSLTHFGRSAAKAVDQPTGLCWGFLGALCTEFEGLAAIRSSETPRGLRLFSYALINLSCIALAPFWAHFCSHEVFQDTAGIGEDFLGHGAADALEGDLPQRLGCASAYLVGALFTVIVLSLFRVQQELVDPFDGRGPDDIRWDAWRAELDRLG